jgi:biopolymer transport protein ExbB
MATVKSFSGRGMRCIVGACVVLLACACSAGASIGDDDDPSGVHDQSLHNMLEVGDEAGSSAPQGDWELVLLRLRGLSSAFAGWYRRTPPADRVTWGGLTACAGLGIAVVLERLGRLRSRKTVPADFTERFLDRLHDGRLDCGQALDHCEQNPSPAARVAIAAVRRWGRPAGDLERAVAMAHRVEVDRLRRNVGTLRRVAALAPLLGLLGTLFAAGRVLESIPAGPELALDAAPVAWGPMLASALSPLCTGIVIATLALAAYDGLVARIEKLAGALDRLGAETIDAIAMSTPVSSPLLTFSSAHSLGRSARMDHGADSEQAHIRTPHRPLLGGDERPVHGARSDRDPTESRPHDDLGFSA